MSTDPQWDAAARRRRGQRGRQNVGDAMQGIGSQLFGYLAQKEQEKSRFQNELSLDEARRNADAANRPTWGAFAGQPGDPNSLGMASGPQDAKFMLPFGPGVGGIPMTLNPGQPANPLVSQLFPGGIPQDMLDKPADTAFIQAAAYTGRDRLNQEFETGLAGLRHGNTLKEIQERNKGGAGAASPSPQEMADSPEFNQKLSQALPGQLRGSQMEAEARRRVAAGENYNDVLFDLRNASHKIMSGRYPLSLGGSPVQPGSVFMNNEGYMVVEQVDKKGQVTTRELTAAEIENLRQQIEMEEVARSLGDQFSFEDLGTSQSSEYSNLEDAPQPLRPDAQEYMDRTSGNRDRIRQGIAEFFRTNNPGRPPSTFAPKH